MRRFSLERAVARGAVVGALLCSVPGLPAEEPTRAVVARIKEEGRKGSRVAETFAHLTNRIGPRLTGSPAYREAADWTAARLREWGLANVRLEPFEFGRGWTLETLRLEMLEPRYVPLLGHPEAWTPSTRGELVGSPVYVGDLSEEQLRAKLPALRGAIVLATRPVTEFIREDRPQPTAGPQPVRIGAPPAPAPGRPADRRRLAELMREARAGVVLQPSPGQHGTIFVTGRRDTPDDAAPSVVLAAEHYNLIVRRLEAGTPVKLRVDLRVRYHGEDGRAVNVLAEIPGADPRIGDEVVLLGAHLDSWHAATGASDNADGVASLMEAVRILRTLGVSPRRTIRIALWGGEEQGLLGSRAHVERHYAGQGRAAEREKLYVYLNHDPGTGPIYGFYLEGDPAVKPAFDAWLEPLEDVGARRNPLPGIGSTDHVSFLRAGLPGFNTVQDYTDYDVRTHHTSADFYERVRVEDLQQAAIVLAAVAYQASIRNEPLPRASGRTPPAVTRP